MNDDLRHEIGSRLREAREYLNLTQQEVAESLGLQRSAISLIELGQRRLETLELKQLAEMYRRPISYFTGEGTLQQPEEILVLMRKAEAMSVQDRQEILQFADWLLSKEKRVNPVVNSLSRRNAILEGSATAANLHDAFSLRENLDGGSGPIDVFRAIVDLQVNFPLSTARQTPWCICPHKDERGNSSYDKERSICSTLYSGSRTWTLSPRP